MNTNHSWYDKHAHIFRTDGRVVRATLGELVESPSGIYIKATFLHEQHSRIKHVSPLTVAALQVMWVNVDVVSDVELPDDLDSVTDFVAPRECDRLPLLVVTQSKLSDAMQNCVQHVNHFVKLTSQGALPSPTIAAPSCRRRSRKTA